MVVAVPDNPDQAIRGGFEQLPHDPVSPSINHAGTDDDGPQTLVAGSEDNLFEIGAPGNQRDRVDRCLFGRRLGRLTEYPDARRVDEEALWRRHRCGGPGTS